MVYFSWISVYFSPVDGVSGVREWSEWRSKPSVSLGDSLLEAGLRSSYFMWFYGLSKISSCSKLHFEETSTQNILARDWCFCFCALSIAHVNTWKQFNYTGKLCDLLDHLGWEEMGLSVGRHTWCFTQPRRKGSEHFLPLCGFALQQSFFGLLHSSKECWLPALSRALSFVLQGEATIGWHCPPSRVL